MGGVVIGDNINVNTDGVISVALPTKLSELSNDTNYITSANLSAHNEDSNAHSGKFSTFMLPVKRNTTYAVGDCASATGLPSWAYLECITAGTTADTEPLFGGGRVADGTCVWRIKDVRCPYSLGEFVFKMNEPKDYEYLLLCDGSTISEENYPELVAVLGGTQLPNLIDRVVQGAATAGTYKAAGLPNIRGDSNMALLYAPNVSATGAFKSSPRWYANFTTTTPGTDSAVLTFNANDYNSIYGNSDTVQPPAYTAKIYICYAG